MGKDTQTTFREPLRGKRILKNKTVIIITEASEERIDALLRLLDDERPTIKS